MNRQIVNTAILKILDGLYPITLNEFNQAPFVSEGESTFDRLRHHVAILVASTSASNYVYIERDNLPRSWPCERCINSGDVPDDLPEHLLPRMVLTEVKKSFGTFMAGCAFYICNQEFELGDGETIRCGQNLYPMYPMENLIEDLNKPAEEQPIILSYLVDTN